MRHFDPRLFLTVMAGGGGYSNRVKGIAPANLLAYWPMDEASGTTMLDASGNGRTGTYSNVTLGVTGIGDGRTAAGFVPASTSWSNAQAASLAAAFNGDSLTIATWLQVSAAGIWTDGAAHYFCNFKADASNFVTIGKHSVNNQMRYQRNGSVTQSNVIATCSAPTGWVHVALTVSQAASQFIAYFNGVQLGTTQASATNMVGALTTTTIGRQDASYWSGNLAHFAIWNTVLTPAQIATLATV